MTAAALKKKMKQLLFLFCDMWIKYLGTIKLLLLAFIVVTSFSLLCSEQFEGSQLNEKMENSRGVDNSTVVDGNVTMADNATALVEDSAEEVTAKPPNKIFKKISVPEGTSLSLTAQVARSKIAPGFFFDEDGVITDAIVQVPIWLDVDELIDAVYNSKDGDEDEGDERSLPSAKYRRGSERCALYTYAESLISSLLRIPLTSAKHCLLRAVCELHSVSRFYPAKSLLHEVVLLIISPSRPASTSCTQSYTSAGKNGRRGTCAKYARKCPLSITSLLEYVMPLM